MFTIVKIVNKSVTFMALMWLGGSILCLPVTAANPGPKYNLRTICYLMMNLALREENVRDDIRTFVQAEYPDLLEKTARQLDPEGKVAKVGTRQLRILIAKDLIAHAEALLAQAKRTPGDARDLCGLYAGLAQLIVGYDADITPRVRDIQSSGITTDYKVLLAKRQIAENTEEEKDENEDGDADGENGETVSLRLRGVMLSSDAPTWQSQKVHLHPFSLTIKSDSPNFEIIFAGATIRVWQYAPDWPARGAEIRIYTRQDQLVVDFGPLVKGLDSKVKFAIQDQPSTVRLQARRHTWNYTTYHAKFDRISLRGKSAD